MIFLTYAGYSVNTFNEVLWVTAVEYLAVLGYLGWELKIKRSKPNDINTADNILSKP
jgi:hypothetical protein